MTPVRVRMMRLPHGAGLPLPSYESAGAAGMDLRAAEAADLPPGARMAVATGLAIALPDGYEAQVRPRSGLAAKHGVTLLNAPGTIDCDYRGEIKVILINHGDMIFHVARGDRIAQMVVSPVTRAEPVEVAALDDTERGTGGFRLVGRALMALAPEELERYARHIVLADVGGPGQAKLKAAKVLVIGAGGLGSPVLLYLAAAGIGTLGIVDDDTVSLSNLQRQVVHTTARVGTPKTVSAAETIAAINPHVRVIQHRERLTAANAMQIVSGYDIVADGSDNFPTRFLLSDACFLSKKTLVSAAVGQFDGQISTFKPHEISPDGTPYPTYRCLHGEIPPRELLPACEEAGILGALPGIVGSMQAMEVMKEILGTGESLAGRLLLYDALSARFFETKLMWNPDNPLNGRNPSIKNLSHFA